MNKFAIVLLAQLALGAFGGEFVEAYLLIAEPGGELYSCAGHSALRLKCDTYNLDYCYSYESEMVSERVLTFLSGRLKMGMFAVPTEEYLSFYRNDHRGVSEYYLNLPLETKRQLWKIMDEKVAEGVKLPYDYLERGCAQSVLRCLMEAAKPLGIDFGHWPENIATKTRRELFCECLDDFPWNRFFTQSLVGVEADKYVLKYERVVVPWDLLTVLRGAKFAGERIITEEGKALVPSSSPSGASWFSPCFAGVIVALFAILSFLKGWIGRVFSGVLYGIYVGYGVFYTYLVFCSSLPATSWHWLVVPFNILPIVFWKWRKRWKWYFAGMLLIWMGGMSIYPDLLIDPAYYILVAGYMVLCAGI